MIHPISRIVLMAWLLLASFLHGTPLLAQEQVRIFKVPEQFATIQEAIDAAEQNFDVEVSAGTYQERLFIENKYRVTVRGKGKVTIDGSQAGDTVRINDSQDILLENLTITGGNPNGILVTAMVGFGSAQVVRCNIVGNVAHGISASGLNGLYVAQTTISHCGAGGIVVTEGSSDTIFLVTIIRCGIKSVGEHGIYVSVPRAFEGFSTVDILRNFVDGAGADGIHAASPNAVLEGNVVLNADGDGIEVGGQEITLEKNIIMKSRGRGIVLGGDGSHKAARNRILWKKGKNAEVSDGLVIDSNSNHVRENSVMNSSGHGMVIEGRDNQVLSNKVVGSGINGFMVLGGDNLILTNLAKKSLRFDLSDEGDGSNTYRGNKFFTVDPDGNQP